MCQPETRQKYLYLKALEESERPLSLAELWSKMADISIVEFGNKMSAKSPIDRARLSAFLLEDDMVEMVSPRLFAITREGRKARKWIHDTYLKPQVA